MKVCVLCFHDVAEACSFRAKLQLIQRLGRIVGLGSLEERDSTRIPWFILTFDDGCSGVYQNAAPVLEELQVQATVFVVTKLLGQHTPFWWDEVTQRLRAGGKAQAIAQVTQPIDAVRRLKKVSNNERLSAIQELRRSTPTLELTYPHLNVSQLKELEEIGVEIGAHSRTHPCLDQCTDTEIFDEVVGCRKDLTDMLGEPPRAFAYPNGNVDERVVAAVATAGYEYAFLFDHRRQKTPVVDPHRISRLRVDASMPLAKFAAVVSGVLPAIHHLRGRP